MFNETYKTAFISTAHLTQKTDQVLRMVRDADALPFWIHATEYGYIVRFSAFNAQGAEWGELSANEWQIVGCDDLMNIGKALAEAGIDAAHFDADGPMIDGLEDYSGQWDTSA